MDKNELRKTMIQKRKSIEEKLRKKKNQQCRKNLMQHPLFQKAHTIFCYVSLKQEVDTHELIQKNITKKRIVLPVTDKVKKNLVLVEIHDWKNLKKGPFHILEPAEKNETIDPGEIDLAIIPGVAFDRAGNRIGYGLGFYDKILKKIQAPIIGIAYDFQIVKKIPKEKHDIPVNFIITDQEIIDCTKKAL